MITGNSVFRTSLLTGLVLLATSAHAEENHKDFLVRFQAIQTSQPEEAVYVLEKRLRQYPLWHRGRLELARAYFLQGRYPEARAAVKTVVKEAELPDAVKKNVLVFYKKVLEAESKSIVQASQDALAWDFSGKLSIGAGFDSNANTGPADQDIGLDGIRLKNSATEQDDSFSSGQAEFSAEKVLSEHANKYAGGYLKWDNRATVFNRDYQDTKGVSLTGGRLNSRLSYNLTPVWQLGAEAELQKLKYAGDRINYTTLAPWIRWREGRHQVKVNLKLRKRHYTTGLSSKNGHFISPSVQYFVRINPELFASSELGYAIADYNGPQYDYYAVQSDNRLYYLLNSDVLLWGQYRYRSRDYNDAAYSLYKFARDEDYHTFRAGIRYRLSPTLDIDFSVAHFENDANQKLYQYERQQAELKLTWLFPGAK